MSISKKVYVGPFALVLLPLKSYLDAYELTDGALTDNSSNDGSVPLLKVRVGTNRLPVRRVTKKQYCLMPNVERFEPPREFLIRENTDEIVQAIEGVDMDYERSMFADAFAEELEMVRKATKLEVKVCWGVVTWTS